MFENIWEQFFPTYMKNTGQISSIALILPHYPKIGLFPPCPSMFCHKNVDFVIFMQFLAILLKMTPTSWTLMGNPAGGRPFVWSEIDLLLSRNNFTYYRGTKTTNFDVW